MLLSAYLAPHQWLMHATRMKADIESSMNPIPAAPFAAPASLLLPGLLLTRQGCGLPG
jgi:hypothetical protein